MAKQPSKKQQPAKTSMKSAKTSQNLSDLEAALELLARLDADSVAALRDLSAVLGVPMPVVKMGMCLFELGGRPYGAAVTAAQSAAILASVKNGTVFATVGKIISQLNLSVVDAYATLAAPFDVAVQRPAPGPAPPALGCCTCSSGQVANLTQAQCNQFSPSTWTEPADCSGDSE
jgi:hypothetical protein